MTELHVVTGAFGYSGSHIASQLLERGIAVRTVTNSPQRESALQGKIEVHPFDFNQPERLVESLHGASVLYNTYWVRFNAAEFQQSAAVQNTQALFRAAKEAGVQRIVHVSITNPSETSPLEYFRSKAILEKALIESGVSYSILRPALLFGGTDILINNIAWLLRTFPVFTLFGSGEYKVQPIHVEDLARLAIVQGESRDNAIINAIGPETFTYREMVRTIGEAIGFTPPMVSVSPQIGYWISWAMGHVLNDAVITQDEIKGLMDNLLYVEQAPPTGNIALSQWVKENASSLGMHYASEMARRRDRRKAYTKA